jgi:DNA invertase Pin-like site-specific DNA recombinase
MQSLNAASTASPSRCAIYTRKSFQPPIGQEITSLESQRTICSSYIASQQHKGWIELAKHYEDSGLSGATLDRPALRELLKDIENGLVEIVVVYKLDRISRTLLDFVRLMDFFERYGVVFVAITQNFDTSDSMGRLIRNVLLTFAQFEREIASDRMRDKRMVMKQNGMWSGGDAPFGYDLRRHQLIPNPLEAPAVRCIFETYVATKSISAAHKQLIAEGFKRRTGKAAHRPASGGPIALTSLPYILRNPVYIGKVTYKGNAYPGVHQPIVNPDLWSAAQVLLGEQQKLKPPRTEHILTGILFDSYGRRMYARDYWKGAPHRRARYYESRVKLGPLGQRIRRTGARADQLEAIVIESLKAFLVDRPQVRPVLMQAGVFGSLLETLSECSPAAALMLGKLSLSQLSGALKTLLVRVEVADDYVRIVLRVYSLAKFIGWDGVGHFKITDVELARATRLHVISVPVSAVARKRREWLPLETTKSSARPDPILLKLLRQARRAQDLLYEERDKSVADIARLVGKRVGSFSHLVRLNYLAPDIVAAILNGTQPPRLTRYQLLKCELPMDWALQRRMLGFPPHQANGMISRAN